MPTGKSLDVRISLCYRDHERKYALGLQSCTSTLGLVLEADSISTWPCLTMYLKANVMHDRMLG